MHFIIINELGLEILLLTCYLSIHEHSVKSSHRATDVLASHRLRMATLTVMSTALKVSTFTKNIHRIIYVKNITSSFFILLCYCLSFTSSLLINIIVFLFPFNVFTNCGILLFLFSEKTPFLYSSHCPTEIKVIHEYVKY